MTTVTSMWVTMRPMMSLLAKLLFSFFLFFFLLRENQPTSKINIIFGSSSMGMCGHKFQDEDRQGHVEAGKGPAVVS